MWACPCQVFKKTKFSRDGVAKPRRARRAASANAFYLGVQAVERVLHVEEGGLSNAEGVSGDITLAPEPESGSIMRGSCTRRDFARDTETSRRAVRIRFRGFMQESDPYAAHRQPNTLTDVTHNCFNRWVNAEASHHLVAHLTRMRGGFGGVTAIRNTAWNVLRGRLHGHPLCEYNACRSDQR